MNVIEVHIKSATPILYDELKIMKTMLLGVKSDYIAFYEAYIESNSSIVSY